MAEFTIALAGKRIALDVLFDSTREFCQEYLTEEPADFSVRVRGIDLQFEHEKSKQEAIAEGKTPQIYSPEYLETLAVYRKIAEKMLDYDTLLFHGSVISVDGEGYLFTATSGTGKSTHTRFWRETFGERAFMVNDDKPLLRITEDRVLVYGTPWDGKHRLSTNTVVPLKGLCILNRAEENHIEPLPANEAMPMLLQQSHRPSNPAALAKLLMLLEKMTKQTGLYTLGCNLNPEAAMVAYNGMNRKDN